MNKLGRNWLPSGGSVAGVLAAFVALLLVGFPIMVLVLQSGGGCEGQPRPCEPDNTAIYIGLTAVVLLSVGTWWGVRKLVNFFVHGD